MATKRVKATEPEEKAEDVGRILTANELLAVRWQKAVKMFEQPVARGLRDPHKVAAALSRAYDAHLRVLVAYEDGRPALLVQPKAVSFPTSFEGYRAREVAAHVAKMAAEALERPWNWPAFDEVAAFARGYQEAEGSAVTELEDLRRKVRELEAGQGRSMHHAWPPYLCR